MSVKDDFAFDTLTAGVESDTGDACETATMPAAAAATNVVKTVILNIQLGGEI